MEEDSDRCSSRRLKCRVGRRESKATFFNKHRSSKEVEERGRSKPRRERGSLRRMRGKELGRKTPDRHTLRSVASLPSGVVLAPVASLPSILLRSPRAFFSSSSCWKQQRPPPASFSRQVQDRLPKPSVSCAVQHEQESEKQALLAFFSFAHFCCRPSPLLLLGQSRSSWEARVLLLGLASAQPQPSHLVNLPSVTSFRRFSPARTTNAAETLLPPTTLDVESVDGVPIRRREDPVECPRLRLLLAVNVSRTPFHHDPFPSTRPCKDDDDDGCVSSVASCAREATPASQLVGFLLFISPSLP